jgi:putative oxidoreductase
MSASTEAVIESGPRRQSVKSALGFLCRVIDLGIGFVLLRAALAHLGNPYFFLSSIYDYQLLPPRAGEVVAVVLPHIELTVAVCLVLGWWRHAAALVAGFMLFGFSAIQSVAWARGLEISCGCFGPSSTETVGGWAVLRDVGICATAWLDFALGHRLK